MSWLYASVPFCKVLAAFALMLVAIRCRLALWLSILAGGFALGILFGLNPLEWTQTAAIALIQPKFLLLISVVGLILVLSEALEKTGQSKRLMDALSGYLTRPRLRLIFFPALIGLLPMPGGAVFSAPMVKAVSEDLAMADEDRALINYWFRHVWEVAWPLYPGVILTVALAGIPISGFIAYTWPGVLAMFGFGWWFFLRGSIVDLHPQGAARPVKGKGIAIFMSGLPLLIAIAGAIGAEVLMGHVLPDQPMELGVITALTAAVGCVMLQNRLGGRFLLQALTRKGLWTMLLVIAAIFIFKDVMAAAGVVQAMAGAAGGGAALFAASVFLPFLVGMVSGINVAFVGATFPLILGLLHTLGMDDQVLPYLILGTFSGFTGVMVSPLHICFLLTANYFGADLGRTWRRLVPPCLGMAATGLLLFAVLV